ncbi:MAG: UV DNA damage repair endonuclease UvsE [Myxococcaceae bacterium]
MRGASEYRHFRLGYVAQSLALGMSASHTCRVANATARNLTFLTAQNLAELEQLLLYNESLGIGLFRVGSSLVPLASHPVNRTRWWLTFGRDLEAIGRIARRSGQRLSMHPSPAGASLASARPAVREATRAELRYSARVLDLLGQPPEARVVVHLGGAQPDRSSALEAAHRFLDVLDPDLHRRLTLENDDRVWPASDVLPLAREHGLPFVADVLHDRVLPSTPPLPLSELLADAVPTWRALGLRPKVHLSSQRPRSHPGAHADRIAPADALTLLEALPAPADVMLEAKHKDLALLALRRALEARGHRVGLWRPSRNEGLRPSGSPQVTEVWT